MAIEYRGFSGEGKKLDTLWWARHEHWAGVLRSHHGVVSGAVVSSGGAGRVLSVSAFEAKLPGIAALDTAAGTVTVAENSSGFSRYDRVCLTADWGSETVALQAVGGDNISLPTLTRTAGVLWQMPLAWVEVRPGVSTIAAGDIYAAKPLPVASVFSRQTVASGQAIDAGGSGILQSVTMPDPGWPYRVRVNASVRFNVSTGFGLLTATTQLVSPTGGSIETTICESYSPQLSLGGNQMTHLVNGLSTGALSGVGVTARLRASTALMSGGDQLVVSGAPVNFFTVEQVPA